MLGKCKVLMVYLVANNSLGGNQLEILVYNHSIQQLPSILEAMTKDYFQGVGDFRAQE
jgi:hypothetical protein